MHIKLNILIITCFLMSLVTSCSGGKMANEFISFKKLNDVPDSAWQLLSRKKIYFGHQSIGFNIMAGVEDILRDNPELGLNIVETSDPVDFNKSLFAHSRVGKNHEPLTKIKGFTFLMENLLGDKSDIAFFKFCNVDINSKTDVNALFIEYSKELASLKIKYPQTTFVHITSPLRIVQTGIQVPIKKLLGRPIDGYDDNAKRGEYSELIRKTYAGKEPVFDLSMIESTLTDGSRATFVKDGNEYLYLAPEYTKDGGHLNERGRKFVAEQLLIFLATLPL